MSKFDQRDTVFSLRRQGESISEIMKTTGLSKSTVSYWCRKVKLTAEQKNNLVRKMIAGGKKGSILGAFANRRKKEISIEEAKIWANNNFMKISSREFFFSGIALYWAGGSKSYSENMSFVNSDPKMVKFMYEWFRNIFGVKRKDFIVRVSINQIHQDRLDKVLKFWENLLDLPQDNFRKTILIKTKQKKIYKNHDNYFGQLILRIRRSSVIRYRILALTELLKDAGVAQLVRAYHS